MFLCQCPICQYQKYDPFSFSLLVLLVVFTFWAILASSRSCRVLLASCFLILWFKTKFREWQGNTTHQPKGHHAIHHQPKKMHAKQPKRPEFTTNPSKCTQNNQRDQRPATRAQRGAANHQKLGYGRTLCDLGGVLFFFSVLTLFLFLLP